MNVMLARDRWGDKRRWKISKGVACRLWSIHDRDEDIYDV